MSDTMIGLVCLTAVFLYLCYLVGRRTCKVGHKNRKICFVAEESCGFRLPLIALVFSLVFATSAQAATTICIEGEPVDGKVPYSCTMEEPTPTYSMKEKGSGGFLGPMPKSLPSVAGKVVIWIAQEVAKEFITKYLEEVMNKKVIVISKAVEPVKSH